MRPSSKQMAVGPRRAANLSHRSTSSSPFLRRALMTATLAYSWCLTGMWRGQDWSRYAAQTNEGVGDARLAGELAGQPHAEVPRVRRVVAQQEDAGGRVMVPSARGAKLPPHLPVYLQGSMRNGIWHYLIVDSRPR